MGLVTIFQQIFYPASYKCSNNSSLCSEADNKLSRPRELRPYQALNGAWAKYIRYFCIVQKYFSPKIYPQLLSWDHLQDLVALDWLWLSWGGGVPGPGHVGDEYIKTKPTLKTAWSWTCLLLVWTWQIGSVVAGSQSEHRLGVWWKLMTGPSHVWSKPNGKELSKFYGHPCLCLLSTST